MVNLISLQDLEGHQIGPNISRFDALLAVVQCALKKEGMLHHSPIANPPVQLKTHKPNKTAEKQIPNQDFSSCAINAEENPHHSDDTLANNCDVTVEENVESTTRVTRLNTKSKRKNAAAAADDNFVVKPRKKKAKAKVIKADDSVTPDMPDNLKEIIRALGGSDIRLVIQKRLFLTDTTQGQNRFSIPYSKIKTCFLTDAEKEFLNNNGKEYHMDVKVIDPSLQQKDMVFKRWQMKKPNGKVTEVYNLIKNWYKLVDSNGLNENDLVQLWSYRVAAQSNELCFAIVVVERVGQMNASVAEGGDAGPSSSIVDDGADEV